MNTSSGYGGESMADYDEEINWDEVGNPPSVGDYNVVVEKAEYKQSSQKKHMVKVQLKIEGYDPKNPDLEKNIGRTLFTNFNFTSQGGFVVKGFQAATCDQGVELPRSVNRAILEEWCASIVGIKVGVSVKHRPWNDQIQADIAKWFAPMELDNSAIDDQGGEEEEVEEEEEEQEEEQEEEVEEAAPPQRSLREAAAASSKKTNGHTNGHTNGARTAAKPPPPKSKPAPAKKSSTRR